MILNKSQAQAVFDAMCALNNVGGLIDCIVGQVRVTEMHNDTIRVVLLNRFIKGKNEELFNSQAEFAEAYRLL